MAYRTPSEPAKPEPVKSRMGRFRRIVTVLGILSFTTLVLCLVTYVMGMHTNGGALAGLSASTTTFVITWFNLRNIERAEQAIADRHGVPNTNADD